MSQSMMLFLLLLPTFAQAFNYSVIDILGSQAFYSAQGSATRSTLSKGMKLSDGDTVHAENRTAIFLLSSAGHKINIGPNSAVFLDSGRQAGDSYTVANLLHGGVRSIVKKSGTNSKKFELRTKSFAIGVRGTDFLSVLNGESLQVYLENGTLELPNQHSLTGGHSALIHSPSDITISPMSGAEYEHALGIAGLGSSGPPAEADKDANPTAGQPDPKKSPLMAAIERKDTATVKKLLSSGANKEAKDSQGLNAYDYARQSENKEIQNLLFR